MNITIEARSFRPFMRLLEEGVILQVPEGLSVREALTAHFGIDPFYLENQVQTLFLNGKPVDDLDQTRVGEKSVLALSAAMPGLVGATLRRDGYYAAMRHRIDSTAPPLETGKSFLNITVKLFNMVAKDLGESLFKGGIRIDGDRFRNLLKDQEKALKNACTRIAVDGAFISLPTLLSMDIDAGGIFLTLAESPD